METNNKYDALSIRELLKTIGFSEEDLTAPKKYMNTYHAISDINNGSIEGIQLGSIATYRLANLGKIKTKNVGDKQSKVYHLYDVAQYILERDLFFEQVNKKKLLTFDYILRQFGHTGKEYLGSKYINNFKQMHEGGFLKLLLLGERLYPYPRNFFFVLGDSFEEFNNKYISIVEVSKGLGLQPFRLSSNYPGEIISLLDQYKFKFISRTNMSNINEFISKSIRTRSPERPTQVGYVSKSAASIALGIGGRN